VSPLKNLREGLGVSSNSAIFLILGKYGAVFIGIKSPLTLFYFGGLSNVASLKLGILLLYFLTGAALNKLNVSLSSLSGMLRPLGILLLITSLLSIFPFLGKVF
jgi:hypothetical protein